MNLFDFTSLNVLLVIIALAGFAYLSWQRILWGMYIVGIFLPVYLVRLTIGPFPTTVLELAILILFTVWLLKDRRWKHIRLPWKKTSGSIERAIPWTFALPVSLLLVSAFVSMVLSPNSWAAFGIFKAYFLEPCLLLIVCAYELKDERHADYLIRWMGITVIVLAAVSAWQYLTGLGIPNPFWADPMQRRATSIYGYPNAASLYATPLIALYAGYLRKSDKLWLMLYRMLVIVCGLVLIMTAKTTGAILALAAVLWVVGVWNKPTRLVTIGLTIILATFIIKSPDIQQSFSTFTKNVSANHLDLSSNSFEIRINQWRETAALLRDHPIKGAGLANYQQALVPYHTYQFLEIYLYPHNIFLNFWVELGILGLIAKIWLIIAVVIALGRALRTSLDELRPRAIITGSALAWLAYFVHGLVDVPYFKNDLSALTMILVAFTILAARRLPDRNL